MPKQLRQADAHEDAAMVTSLAKKSAQRRAWNRKDPKGLYASNKSGVNGIWFQHRLGQGTPPRVAVYVCSAYVDEHGKQRRVAYSVKSRGREGALMEVMRIRQLYGMYVAPFASVKKALNAYIANLRKTLSEGVLEDI